MARARLAYGLVAAALLGGQELPRGTVVDRVVCRENEGQSYALYLPSTYSARRKWPIVYCLDPGARGPVPVERFAAAAESAGFLVVGSNNSRNGPLGPVQEAIAAMLGDTEARFALDPTRVYAAGFSGGARVALAWARNGRLAGVVACGAGFGSALPERIPFRIFATAGVDDFNYHEIYAMSVALAKRGVEHRFEELEGGHDWLTPAAATDALQFFDGRLPAQAARESREETKQAARFARTAAEFAGAEAGGQRALASRLRRQAAAADDSPGRRLARQALHGAYVGALETARSRMEERDYAAAARSWETAAVVEPENAGTWYQLAVAQCAAGDRSRALEALERAAAAGFHDVERMEREPLLAPLRKERRYRALAGKIGG